MMLLVLPFASAHTLYYSVNTSVPYSTNYSYSWICNNQTHNESVLITGSTPVFFNNSVVLDSNNNFSATQNNIFFNLSLTNLTLLDKNKTLKVGLGGLKDSKTLILSFNTSFYQPEPIIIHSDLFNNNLTYYIKKPISYEVLTNFSNYSRTYNVTFEFPSLNKTIIKNISFVDTQKPIISVYKPFDQMKVGGLYTFRIYYSDLSGINKINTSTNGDITISKSKRGDYINFLITPNEYGTFDINFSLTDGFNNTIVVPESFVITPKQQVFFKNFNIPRLRTGKTHIFDLYNGDYLSFNISLFKQSFSGNKTPVLWIKTNDGQVQLIPNTTQIISSNKLSLMIESDYEGDYDGSLRITYPRVIKGNNVFRFKTTFANYTLLPRENLSINGVVTNCKLVEEPNFEDSKVVCSVSLPYDTVSEDTLMIVPKRDFKWYQDSMNKEIREWQDKFKNQRFLKNTTLIILGIVLLSVFGWVAKPNFVFIK